MSIYKKFFFKIIIIGNSGVGKTTLLHQYLEDKFKPNVQSTIGVNFFVKRFKLPQVENMITLQAWDMAGQEHYKWVRREFYFGAKGIIYVFDLTQKNTFYDLLHWKKEIEKVIPLKPSVLVGNKMDLIINSNKVIDLDEIDNLKEKINANAYFETSAKLGDNVDDVFTALSLEMYNSL